MDQPEVKSSELTQDEPEWVSMKLRKGDFIKVFDMWAELTTDAIASISKGNYECMSSPRWMEYYRRRNPEIQPPQLVQPQEAHPAS
jgi:hypothetical protein